MNKGLWAMAGVVTVLVLAGRWGAAVSVACAILVAGTAPRRCGAERQTDCAPVVALAAAVFAIWLFPEFVVADAAHRPVVDWKRWNLTMRFWLEGYYLIPLLVVLAWAPTYTRAFANRLYVRLLAGCTILVTALWLSVHAYAIADRSRRTPDEPSLDGTALLLREHPRDLGIIEHLRTVPGPVRIAELCGTGEIVKEVKVEYDWPGRMAAFSGRAGLCGWSKHVWQFSRKLRHPEPTGPWTWVRFREIERNLQQAFDAARTGETAAASRAFFDRLGVTHLIVGEQEQRVFPGLSADALATAIGGAVIYRGENGDGIVSLTAPLPNQAHSIP
jgi:uncharacterized membrane protein